MTKLHGQILIYGEYHKSVVYKNCSNFIIYYFPQRYLENINKMH